MRVFQLIREIETDIYSWSSAKIIKNFNHREFNKASKGEGYSFGIYLNVERLRVEFMELEEYLYCVGIREYNNRFEE
jgi:hypothetical protein